MNTASGFADRMRASFPAGVTVPAALDRFFDWQQAAGLARSFRSGGDYAGIDTASELGCMYSQCVDPGYAEAWLPDAPQEVRDRLAPFFRTGGDGSTAALWRDDDGAQHIVHLGSGSGSTMLGVLASDPVDFLRLLAIGYEELCWPENFDRAPAQIDAENEYLDQPVWDRAAALRDWVQTSFGVAVPAVAAEISPAPADMGDRPGADPFLLWVRKWQGDA
ncbi:hypothetical protein AB2M62_19890 [Sphingomonas sp. MMS12-HWE2-04]|uniref:hypothetical protein n=1 Tax=Sphingomonas sp. MMS12-HWE2-04 TaxID=3234199 RepID=UPI00384B5839